MNPWRENVLDNLRNIFRFALWACLVVNGLMASFFTIFFTYEFLRHLWAWCERVLFQNPW